MQVSSSGTAASTKECSPPRLLTCLKKRRCSKYADELIGAQVRAEIGKFRMEKLMLEKGKLAFENEKLVMEKEKLALEIQFLRDQVD